MNSNSISVQDVHVAELRKLHYPSLIAWLREPNHVYIGRRNVYVPGTYESPFANPYPVAKYGLTECLRLYELYIKKKLDNNPSFQNELNSLRGKVLGCWCTNSNNINQPTCHAHILIKLLTS